jgi:hypothetical protein
MCHFKDLVSYIKFDTEVNHLPAICFIQHLNSALFCVLIRILSLSTLVINLLGQLRRQLSSDSQGQEQGTC